MLVGRQAVSRHGSGDPRQRGLKFGDRRNKKPAFAIIVIIASAGVNHIKCFLQNARPEPDLRYFSNFPILRMLTCLRTVC